MAHDWEVQFREWAKPPGTTEQERSDNAVSAIRNAIELLDEIPSDLSQHLVSGVKNRVDSGN